MLSFGFRIFCWYRGFCHRTGSDLLLFLFEPSKPRLCHDDRFLNLWVRDLPFKLDTLRDVHRLVRENAVMVTTD